MLLASRRRKWRNTFSKAPLHDSISRHVPCQGLTLMGFIVTSISVIKGKPLRKVREPCLSLASRFWLEVNLVAVGH